MALVPAVIAATSQVLSQESPVEHGQRTASCDGGAENAGQDIAGQDNDGQKKHHAWVEIKT